MNLAIKQSSNRTLPLLNRSYLQCNFAFKRVIVAYLIANQTKLPLIEPYCTQRKTKSCSTNQITHSGQINQQITYHMSAKARQLKLWINLTPKETFNECQIIMAIRLTKISEFVSQI
ncbi:Hypothetical_protein [Hexamita inflata]|uniref:Hypothetical_protein n=1 Tax=Hexamita inflata TaxID=28002 RepID=A0AA86UNR8_9EUKA|nr:Hypothetical protein HINF_LOCUS46156 [Hexamita inflata]